MQRYIAEEHNEKKSCNFLLTLVMSLGPLAGCGKDTVDEPQQDGESGAKQIETLEGGVRSVPRAAGDISSRPSLQAAAQGRACWRGL